jgi:hypothetical protein
MVAMRVGSDKVPLCRVPKFCVAVHLKKYVTYAKAISVEYKEHNSMLNLYLAFCLTAQTDKPLELGI